MRGQRSVQLQRGVSCAASRNGKLLAHPASMNFEPGVPYLARLSAAPSSDSNRPFSSFSAADLAFLNLPAGDGHGARGEALLLRLREETSASREELEACLPILSPPITELSYRRYCSALWGFYQPLERHLRPTPGLARALEDLPRRWKTELLELDLAELGVPIPELALAVCKDHPGSKRGRFDLSHALGALYALELCTLSFRHTQRYLSHVLPSMTARASHFLGCYGADTERLWEALCAQICAALEAGSVEGDALVEGAVETLRAAQLWFRQTFADHQLAAGDRLGLSAPRKRAPSSARWAAELERAVLRTWPQLGLTLPSWSELERNLPLWRRRSRQNAERRS
jgi:heme oxygenase